MAVPNNPEPPQPVLLLTRPKAASEDMVRRLDLPVRTIISPILEITGRPLHAAPQAKALIFTSAHGVAEAARQGIDRSLPVFTVGDATAAAARAAGWRAESAGQTADELVDRLTRDPPPIPLAHLHGAHTRGDVARRLSENGLRTEAHVIYDQTPRPLNFEAIEALNAAQPVILPVFSPRSAVLLAEAGKPLAPLHVIALSSAVAEEFHVSDISALHVCAAPTRAAMDAALKVVVRGLCRVERPKGEH